MIFLSMLFCMDYKETNMQVLINRYKDSYKVAIDKQNIFGDKEIDRNGCKNNGGILCYEIINDMNEVQFENTYTTMKEILNKKYNKRYQPVNLSYLLKQATKSKETNKIK